jgi:hypothetical protein
VCILCANPLEYVSVAECNHSTCSLCAARLRLKSQDRQCVVCKRQAAFTIVYRFQPAEGFRSFESFCIPSEDSLPLPGVEPEYRSKMLFVSCPQHSKAMAALIGMSCAVCSQRFGSERALFKHVKAAHRKEFCQLCFANRPLFPCEQQLMTPAELKAHTNAPPGALAGSGGDKAGGHPPCRFCSVHFYDAQALYVHMRESHFTCHLCPAQHQQRYYRGLSQLIGHLKDSHYTCSLCLERGSGDGDGRHIVAFSHRVEYTEHLRSAHNISSSSGSGDRRALSADHPLSLASAISAAFPVEGTRRQQQAAQAVQSGGEVEFLDLNMSSADPYRTAQQVSSRGGARRVHSQEGEGRWTAAGGFVPDHMRVLGRVTGTGRFYPEEEEEEAEGGRGREVRQQQSSASRSYANRVGAGTGGGGAMDNSEFPALGAPPGGSTSSSPSLPPSGAPSSGTAVAALAARSHHPLSVVPSQSERQRLAREQQRAEQQQREAERELAARRAQRNLVR